MTIASDVEIAQAAKLKPITEVAAELGLAPEEIEPYGVHKAKVGLDALECRKDDPDGKLILVTAMTPTPLGEGKTLTTVGLGRRSRGWAKKRHLRARTLAGAGVRHQGGGCRRRHVSGAADGGH